MGHFLFILPIDKCGQVWYNSTGRQWSNKPEFSKSQVFSYFFSQNSHVLALRTFSRNHPPPADSNICSTPSSEAIGNPKQNPICASNQMNGPPRAGADRISDRYTPYGIFLNLKRPSIWPRFSRKADRESAYGRFIDVKPIGLLLFSPIIIISYFFIKIKFPIGKNGVYFYYTKKILFCQGPHRHLTFIKKFVIIYIQ